MQEFNIFLSNQKCFIFHLLGFFCSGESDQSSLFPLSANHGQGAYLTSDHSKLNVGTDLQPNSDPKSLVSHGLVAHDQPNKDKGKPSKP